VNDYGFAGAAVITAALAILGGPFGMLGGIGFLLVLGLMSPWLAKYGREMYFKGKDNRKIESYPISNSLKKKIKRLL